MKSTKLAAFALATLLSACSAYGPPNSAPPRTSVPRAAPASVTVATTVSLSSNDVTAVRAYYGGAERGNGRNGRRGLPPGIAKNIERGKPLPPGIAKQHVPADLLVRLPAPPSGLEYIVVAGKLLLVEAATQVVRQVLLDAVF